MGLFEEKRECFDTGLGDELIWDETGDEDRIELTDRGLLNMNNLLIAADNRDSHPYIHFEDEVLRLNGLDSQSIGSLGYADFNLV